MRRAGIVGAGTMGAAIAELLAFNGIDVVLKDVDAERVALGLTKVKGLVDELVAFHAGRSEREIGRIRELGVDLSEEQRTTLRARLAPRVSSSDGERIVGRVHGTTDWGAFSSVDLALEAVYEDLPTKRAVLTELDRVVPPDRPIATNTSSLSVSRLARGLAHVREVVGVHFFNPPSALPLVEVVAGLDTREDLVNDTVDWLQGLRNHRSALLPIRVRESPAFVVNRILAPVLNEAGFALDEGLASAREIDLAMKAGAGFPMGPFELADLIGLDVALAVTETLLRETGDPKYRPSQSLKRRVEAGHLGRKSGRGFYEYP
ncbi:MAG TPA: 3-hydroxyacyl-CoA dehydrogenase family protein [Thermoplasmata archaeon]|nr:3-hydroxyacyl-CoA dehydrogenase family protein [Thermoplasmata archaeon]